MAVRLVIADASTLIGLASAGAFDLLRQLFDRVAVTSTVRDEGLAGDQRPGASELAAAIRDGWITVMPVTPDPALSAELDAGEASTLTVALGHAGPCLVLMDERRGRKWADNYGLKVIGLAGILIEAKQAGLVKRIRPFFERLDRDDFRLSGDLVRGVLDEAGEA